MKTNLKDNIWIDGFDTKEQYNYACFGFSVLENDNAILYNGEMSDISEEIAKKYVVRIERNGDRSVFVFYKNYNGTIDAFPTAQRSIKSACDKKYCIIYTK